MLIKENKEEVKNLIIEANKYIDDFIEEETRTPTLNETIKKYLISDEHSVARWISISSFLTILTLINAVTIENLFIIPMYWILIGIIELTYRK